MYLNHFGLNAAPFSLTPDTRSFFGTQSHVDAINTSVMAVRMGEGLVKITGEVGTGKTMVCRLLLSTLAEECTLVFLPNPANTVSVLYRMIADELTLPEALSEDKVLGAIQQAAIAAAHAEKPVLILCDEAQALPDGVLEAIRLLGNLETEQRKLIQIVLFGQPELDERLSQHNMRQLLQRISFSATLLPLTYAEASAYIDHRMSEKGALSRHFSGWAKRRIWVASQGIPRLIHQLCHKSLLLSYGKGRRQVSDRAVRLAIKDTPLAKQHSALRALWG
ncbi:MSHA biogenesis protein MshM [Enterovibrio norvegicus]|uniref:MSHA biogenesis protein MshM n=2 Tax=Enterovibrio norvegicus TaxID=188144 RepID=A0A1I5R1I1_9GAMM|nr:AAA family ATPase [Enterovibrio norvegicus]OEF52725.1 MSHA biogenesis protein MshM [Enterovibrio norvegicus]OEF57702.1 MSHA biogenesis protein MshM [Enterovibrio norvegicus]SFP52197.1 MSHA biogenesis protein MshM [Enterovibrio norvegicus DSM 15893]